MNVEIEDRTAARERIVSTARPGRVGEGIFADTRFLAVNLAHTPYPVW